MSQHILKFLILAVLVGAGAGYLFMRGGDSMIAVKPQRGPAVQAVYATGTVEPTIMLPIAPRTGARLTALLADEGQAVTKGQTLAQLEDTDMQKTLDEMRARLDQAQKEYDRKTALRKNSVVSQQALDQAEADLKAAQASLDRAAAEIGFLKLQAPEDGRIIRRDGEAGQFIPAGQAVFWMECCAPLRISVAVDEEDIPLVQPGQKVLIHADAFPDDVFYGKVQAITPKGDDVSRSFRVRIGLDGNTPLMTGMTAEANIISREDKNAILIPPGIVKKGMVWVLRGGKTVQQKVEIGAQGSKGVEILGGLTEEDVIIENPPADIAEGQGISVVQKEWALDAK